MIKKIIPEAKFQAGMGGFEIPKGYYFVRRLPNQYASEYYLFPFHWFARLYWRAWYRGGRGIWKIIMWYAKKKKKAKINKK